MKLTLPVLDNLLTRKYKTSHKGAWNQKSEISDIFLWNGTVSCKTALYLYIGPVKADSETGCGKGILTVAAPSEHQWARRKKGYFLYWDSENKTDAANVVLELFRGCERWINEVHELACISQDLGILLKCGSDFLECNCSIVNTRYEFEIAADGKISKTPSGPKEPYGKDSFTSAAAIEDVFLSNADFEDTFEKRGLTYFENRMHPEMNCYFYNFMDQNEYKGRILISGAAAYPPGFLQLCEYYAREVENCYLSGLYQASPAAPFNRLRQAITEMLSGANISRTEIAHRLQEVGWNISDTYEIIKLSTTGYLHSQHTLNYFCQKIEQEITSAAAVGIGETILCFHNLSMEPDEAAMEKKLSYFVRENLFQGGISCRFHNFFDGNIYERQASFALADGIKENPDIWLHKFPDSAFRYCMTKLNEDYPHPDIIQPALGRLHEYDRKNPEIQLTRTLYQYMANQYNATYTAHVLGIHRTTLLYRLNKMQQIFPFDLNDPQVCLHLLLSYELMPELKGYPCNH